jgi:hypothetical protein
MEARKYSPGKAGGMKFEPLEPAGGVADAAP